ncbi:MAG: hypothetical protein NC452_02270 [Eubacterium sp.]|nr:hypothetical protein [Eubacterium sp.]
MQYITHHRFKGISACENVLNIPYRTRLEEIDGSIFTVSGEVICFSTSENAHKHFFP